VHPSTPAVAHLVTPYLFLTGSWVHAQLVHNPRYRAVVMTQKTENLELFPQEPIHDFTQERGRLSFVPFLFSKYILGRFPAGPYLRAIQEEGPVLLHAHFGWDGARLVHLRRRLRLPFITSFYGRDASMLPRKAYWRRLYKSLFHEGDLFLAEGPFMGETLRRLGCPAEKIRVIHLGIDLTRIEFKERCIRAQEGVTGLIAASFREKKGIEYALEAVARIHPGWPGLRLRIVGDGPLRSHIERRISRPDLEGRVTLLGYQGFPAYIEELERADFLLAPSVTAADGDTEGGAPVCLLEAQAAGLPILATTHCDIPEVTVPEGSAFLSPERDVDALAANLERLLMSPQRWPEMGRKGRAHVESQFNIRRQAERMADLYDELLVGS